MKFTEILRIWLIRGVIGHFWIRGGWDIGIPRGSWNWSNDLRIWFGREGSWTLERVGRPRERWYSYTLLLHLLFPRSSFSISFFLLLAFPPALLPDRKEIPYGHLGLVTAAKTRGIPRRSSTLKSDMTRIERMIADNSNESRSFKNTLCIDLLKIPYVSIFFSRNFTAPHHFLVTCKLSKLGYIDNQTLHTN